MNEIPLLEKIKSGYLISTDKSKLQPAVIHSYLSKLSYWAKNIPEEIMERSISGSVCFAVYEVKQEKEHLLSQVGFARVITDGATFGYLADVFILPEHQGRGLAKWLMKEILSHPALSGFRRWMLATKDAHSLYEKSGFERIIHPERFMRLSLFDEYPVPDNPEGHA